MAKIAQVSSKYIIHSTINIDGVVDRPDVIGAIFGQTEGLLGEDLELRELQKSGRIGRIEVNTDTKNGKTTGEIIIPSSLDKAETAIIGAALEVIQRIGPCNAKIQVSNIEDIRISKRKFVIDRAKSLLKELVDGVMPDSQELADEVAYSVRVAEITEFGKERLSAGPNIDDSDDIIVVEGRADVLNLLKYGFKNAIAVGGTGIPKTIIDLCKQKTVTVFVDGDRGGDLIIRELTSQTEIDFVAKAPDGKEVEELTKKEIHKGLRGQIAIEQIHLEAANGHDAKPQRRDNRDTQRADRRGNDRRDTRTSRDTRSTDRRSQTNSRNEGTNNRRSNKEPTADEKEKFNSMLEDLIGTRGAYILDKGLQILGKIPVSELESTVKSLNNTIHAIVFDGDITKELLDVSEKSNVSFLIGMSSKVTASGRTKILTPEQLA
ncbi:DNA primase [Candidatus Woesearchaeota archaeon]|nr:DNA primase [Candidatus Woesearchaeota archaeon]